MTQSKEYSSSDKENINSKKYFYLTSYDFGIHCASLFLNGSQVSAEPNEDLFNNKLVKSFYF